MSNIRTTNPQLDTSNPLAKEMIEMMRERGRKAKEGDIIRISNGKPLTGKQYENARESFEEYFSEDYVDDDTEE